MVEQTAAEQDNYLDELYKDLYVKSAVDTKTTIDIISWMEDLSCGVNTENQNDVFSMSSCLPGKPLMELIAEFRKYWVTNNTQPKLDIFWELRDSLYRFQSL